MTDFNGILTHFLPNQFVFIQYGLFTFLEGIPVSSSW